MPQNESEAMKILNDNNSSNTTLEFQTGSAMIRGRDVAQHARTMSWENHQKHNSCLDSKVSDSVIFR